MMAPTPGPGMLVTDHTDASRFVLAPRKSMSVSTKGLLNMPGQNNCFLNSAVQVLWHLDSFRRSFRELTGHACMAESCIFCALKDIFTQFQYSQESALPPDVLRHALAKTFCDQRRFQLGFMDDAAECFENILMRIHVHIANQETEDACSNANCIPHQKFAMTLVEQRMCHNCGAKSDPMPFTQMVHYVTTSALCVKAMESRNADPNFRSAVPFGAILRLAGDMGEIRECPSNCGSKVQVKKTLMNRPEVVSIGLVWDSESPTLQHITDVFHSIGMFLQLQDMFHFVYDSEWAENTTHQMVGIVTYYGKHYSTFFFHTKLKIWIYFDDAAVREVGPSWEQVVEKCQRGRFQPLLLLFANPESSLENDHPMQYANRASEALKSVPFNNQRQAVINQYLKFQNSFLSANPKLDYNHIRNIHTHNPLPQEPFVHSGYRKGDPGLPIYQNTSQWNVNSYRQGMQDIKNHSQLPMYSNLHYLNSIQQNDQVDVSRLNEVSLPTAKPLPTIKPYENDILVDKKDFDTSKDSDSAYAEDDSEINDMYISRKTVENVLSQQKRHMSLCRSYSQSSVGNRNSSSSLESFDNLQPVKLSPITSILPENMLVRRDSGSWSSDRNSTSSSNSVENPFMTVMASKRLLLGLNKKSQQPDTNSSDHGYDSFSVSSSDSYPSVNGSPVKLEPRLTQIPEDWQPEEEDLNKKLKLVTEDSNGPPDCDKLCAEADLLLAKSHEKEKDGDLVMAALLCDSAAARARAAMEAPYNSSRSLTSAKMKHSTCVLRSANLYRRLKDHEMDERRKQKGHHSRQSSRDSTHSRHSRQSSKDSTHSKSAAKESAEDAENFGKNIEIYGTLPKKGSRKKNAGASGSLKMRDDQIYKDFLDKQRKNTSLAEELTETSMKNVDPSKLDGCGRVKTPGSDKSHRKSYSEGVLPLSPTRKKADGLPKTPETDTKKKAPRQQIAEPTVQNLHSTKLSNGMEISNRDLLSPISSPDKKQHKIKRKLMGNFMKRKNRSLPDLREDTNMGEKIECFLDDAIIKSPPTLISPPGKKTADPNIASITRGFHQPHRAFVKKDTSQRPLPMKVSPPSVQSPLLGNPKTKLIHTLPSIPRKVPEPIVKPEPYPSVITKPSKIPFISALPKCEAANLPPLSPPRSVDTKLTFKPSALPKTSAIPVLAPQVPLSPLKAASPAKIEQAPDVRPEQPLERQAPEVEDLPQPSNPFLAEIQAKRKQVLGKGAGKEDKPEQGPVWDGKELSMLPKLAQVAPGASWLKELQSKQQQLLCKQDNPKVFHHAPSRYAKEQAKPSVIKAVEIIEEPKMLNPEVSRVWKQPSLEHPCKSVQEASPPVEKTIKATTSSVRDIASRFEKVLKVPDQPPVFSPTQNSEAKQATNAEIVLANEQTASFQHVRTELNSVESSPTVSTNSNLPLKSALKAWTDHNQACDVIDGKSRAVPECQGLANGSASQPVVKQETQSNAVDARATEPPPSPTFRPTQPPDYATAMQRLGLIRTSNSSDVNLAPVELVQGKTESPKRKKGPKKSVTFSDEVVLVACAEYDEIDFSTNPLFERVYQQHVESGKGEIPILSSSYNPQNVGKCGPEDSAKEIGLHAGSKPAPCNLCHSKQVVLPSTYCTDCEFYLSRFTPK